MITALDCIVSNQNVSDSFGEGSTALDMLRNTGLDDPMSGCCEHSRPSDVFRHLNNFIWKFNDNEIQY
jgi:hypothetical protein